MVDVSEIPLPEEAHVPGRNARPDPVFLEEICDKANAVTTEAAGGNNLPWVYGIRLFNEGFYWEAHEVWEAVWMNAPPNSREKHFVQGLIHFANGLLKIRMERPAAARRLFELAGESIASAIPQQDRAERRQFMSLDLVRLHVSLQTARQIGAGDGGVNHRKYEL